MGGEHRQPRNNVNTQRLSPALQAAQALLYQKRAEARAERIRLGRPVDLAEQIAEEATSTQAVSAAAKIATLPEHLGWGSAAYTQAIRSTLEKKELDVRPADARCTKPSYRRKAESDTQTPSFTTHFPADLQAYPHWVCWIEVTRSNSPKPRKLLINPHTGRAAKVNDPATWSDYATAVAACCTYQCQGVGFVFSDADPFVGVDLDSCVGDDGQLLPDAQAIAASLNSYTEYSPSGRGVHIIVKGSLPQAVKSLKGVEMYASGRFFTMTGKRVDDTPAAIATRPQSLQSLYARYTGATRTPGHIAVFGHILDAFQRQKLDGVGRIWLLLRYLDQTRSDDAEPQGRVATAVVKRALAHKSGHLKCLSQKRLRQLLNQGEGRFWHRSKDRQYVYYYKEARVAAQLELPQIRGRAVEVPVKDLLGKITAVRALFYDAFHSARGEGFNNPITRRVLEDRGSCEPRTQRKYERLRGIDTQASFAIVAPYSKAAWQRAEHEEADVRVGGPAFIYIDYKGVLGENPHRFKRPAHQRHWHNIYIVRRIGNAYRGTLRTVKRGRKWANHKLKHLCQSMLSTGSFEQRDAHRFYHDTAAQASKAAMRDKSKPAYHVHHYTSSEHPAVTAIGASAYWQEHIPDWGVDNIPLEQKEKKYMSD